MSEICCLCSQISKDAKADLLASVLAESPDTSGQFIREWTDFVLFPSIGALTIGHVLLCPKVHARSIAALPGELDETLSSASDAVRVLLANVFRLPVHAFEHGNARVGTQVVCTVEHAHLHFLPADVTIDGYLSRYRWTEVVGSLRGMTQGREYLFYQTPAGKRWVTTGDGASFPSQYLRRAFAEALGVADRWNWRDDPAPYVIRQTLHSLTTRDVPTLHAGNDKRSLL